MTSRVCCLVTCGLYLYIDVDTQRAMKKWETGMLHQGPFVIIAYITHTLSRASYNPTPLLHSWHTTARHLSVPLGRAYSTSPTHIGVDLSESGRRTRPVVKRVKDKNQQKKWPFPWPISTKATPSNQQPSTPPAPSPVKPPSSSLTSSPKAKERTPRS